MFMSNLIQLQAIYVAELGGPLCPTGNTDATVVLKQTIRANSGNSEHEET